MTYERRPGSDRNASGSADRARPLKPRRRPRPVVVALRRAPRPSRPIRSRSSGSAQERAPARRRAGPAAPGGTSRPLVSCSTSSGTPMISVATTGISIAIASISTIGTPSAKLGRQKTSARLVERRRSGRARPRRGTRRRPPRRAPRRAALEERPLGAVARERQPRVGDPLEHATAAPRAARRGPCGATSPRRRGSRRGPSAVARARAARTRSRSTPQRTVCTFSSVAGSASAATWLRAKSLMQTTADASATFAASLCASMSSELGRAVDRDAPRPRAARRPRGWRTRRRASRRRPTRSRGGRGRGGRRCSRIQSQSSIASPK